MPFMTEAQRNEPQMDDPGPGIRRWPRAKPRVFKTLRMIHAEALALDAARKRREAVK